VLPDAALLVTGQQQQARLETTEGPIHHDISWSEAKATVRATENAPGS